MKMKLVLLTIMIITLQLKGTYGQEWETATEIWSEPVLLDSLFNIPYHWIESPSLTRRMDTLFYFDSRIYMSYKKNGKWTEPVRLSENVNDFGAMQECSINRDGKRLYISAWGGYGGWDLYYSDWDDTLNDWSWALNMGASISTTFHDDYVYEISEDSIYVIQESSHPNFYTYDSLKNEWTKIDSFWYHPIGGAEMYGLSITGNGRKMYFGKRRWENEWSIDLCVTYWDTTKNYWGDVYYLNINRKSTHVGNLNKGGLEYYPWISQDGKTMIFSSNRNVPLDPDSSDNSSNLFISYLLVDENGDTITNVETNSVNIPYSFVLYQSYPNPFNPSTMISYSVKEKGYVKLIVYDALGKRVAVLVNEEQPTGDYRINFNADDYGLSSGIFYYQLIHNNNYKVKKMILLR